MSNQPDPDQIRESKRAQFTGKDRKRGVPTPILAGVLVLLVAFAAYMVINAGSSGAASYNVAGGEILIPLAELEDGKAKFYDYTVSNKTVRFFAIKSADGVYRAALDACDVCFHAGKGYRQDGDDMVCNNCGLKFHSTLINEVSGGCNPVGLPRTVSDGNLVIRTGEVENRQGYF